MRERWFGATGRRVPELALEGSLDLEGALVLDDVDDDATLREAHAQGMPVVVRAATPEEVKAALARPEVASVLVPDRGAARARPHGAHLWLRPISTYSIVACDLDAGQWGVAVQSKFLAVGSVVPWAEPEVGAVATQAYANPRYGPDGLALLRQGLSAEEVVERLTEADDGRDQRQLGVVDAAGRGATFTGSDCHDWAGGRTGAGYAAQGNILVSGETVDALAETFEATEGSLAERLLASLAAAQAAGGDSRGQQSAALLVVERDGGYAAPVGHRSSTFASTTTRRRSRSCAASTASTTSSSARRRATSGCRSTTSCEPRSTSAWRSSATSVSRTGPARRTSRSASTARTRSTLSCWTS